MALKAVVFDVDGTLVDSEQEGHRVAFNLAFDEMGLAYRWDRDTYRALLAIPGGVPRLRHFLGTQGADGPAAEELAVGLHRLKTGHLDAMISGGGLSLRPGVSELLDDLQACGIRLAVATTGSGRWVGPLLDRLAPGTFEVVVTGSDVERLKPDPACYRLALALLGVGPSEVLAVEDSASGCAAAVGAGLVCVVVTNSDTAGDSFGGAALVVSGFGGPGTATVVADPLGVAPEPPLRCGALAAVLSAVASADARKAVGAR